MNFDKNKLILIISFIPKLPIKKTGRHKWTRVCQHSWLNSNKLDANRFQFSLMFNQTGNIYSVKYLADYDTDSLNFLTQKWHWFIACLEITFQLASHDYMIYFIRKCYSIYYIHLSITIKLDNAMSIFRYHCFDIQWAKVLAHVVSSICI